MSEKLPDSDNPQYLEVEMCRRCRGDAVLVEEGRDERGVKYVMYGCTRCNRVWFKYLSRSRDNRR
jgi:hypothetical protein